MKVYLDMEKLTLGSHYTIRNIVRQSMSPILMMIFISIYGMVDGLFISNFDSTSAFAGVNLVFPLIMIVGGTGFMFGSGGSALTGKLLGEKKRDEANKVFSMMLYFGFIVGIFLSIITFHFIDDFALALSKISSDSTQEMIDKATIYGRILILGQPFFITQNLFQNFFIVDEKPKLGFIWTLASGVTNIVFDAIFIVACKWGVVGAAVATIMGYVVGSIGPIIYFITHKNDLITLVKTKFNFKKIGKCCFNGLSDFVFTISSSIVSLVYNIQLLKYFGQDGVTAYGVIMYVSFVCVSIFIGFGIGIAPIISYNYGAQNHEELKFVVNNMLKIFTVLSIVIVLLGIFLGRPLALAFCKDEALVTMAAKALMLHSFTYLFSGYCIFLTGMFTALNDGLVSGIISLFRSLVLQISCVFVLPLLFGGEALWYSEIVAGGISFLIAFFFYFKCKKKYKY